MTENDIQIAAYYFPNYHPDARNALCHGSGWTEWELVRHATPRFNGHRQPLEPLWGYEDEAQPEVMAKKIDAAADHAVDAFIFDWYWYNDGPFLQNALDKGFLNAANNSRVKFALMWANHDWCDIHPIRYPVNTAVTPDVLYPGAITWQTWMQIVEHCIENYFTHPSYWRIEGKPYFSFYELTKLLESFGGIEGTRHALDYMRQRAREHGIDGLHLNAVVWNNPILPQEKSVVDPAELVMQLGFDSVTSYVWIHHMDLDPFPRVDYRQAFTRYLDYWEKAQRTFSLPYYPNVTVGWDSSPRTVQSDRFENHGYPFTSILANNTPEHFRQALQATRDRLLASGSALKIISLNAWNEWTEGSYLEPDTDDGFARLEAIRDVFAPVKAKPKTAAGQAATAR